ncbi:nuclear transport factor 2 family protein [Streptomyces sp. IBSBF 2507]|uniref:nuclear transport factor 2 family protein n=1 Tax=Streptomyces sp. IBSBF 2507 TaxID=2903530 RepID=UPI00351E8C91
MTTDYQQADHDRAVVAGFYAAMTRADQQGGFTPEDLATVVDFFENEQEIEINIGAPVGGVYRGPDGIALGRHRMHELCGFTHRDHSLDENIADGPGRVVCIGVNHGKDVVGNPWSMTTIELVDLEDGKVIRKRVFFQDPEFLRQIALEREALIKDRLIEEYWRTDNPLIALRKNGTMPTD